MKRILVTGSRDWPEPRAVYDALNGVYKEHGPFLLVHGACSTGADAQAQHWFETAGDMLGCALKRYWANWRGYGFLAGPARNRVMVSDGADLCIAFIGPCTSSRCDRTDPHDSHGAGGCADLAREAGITVRRIDPSG